MPLEGSQVEGPGRSGRNKAETQGKILEPRTVERGERCLFAPLLGEKLVEKVTYTSMSIKLITEVSVYQLKKNTFKTVGNIRFEKSDVDLFLLFNGVFLF